MNPDEKITETTDSVLIVKKWIAIYSNNPMHDAIDRIINSCACIDEGDDYRGLASIELQEAAEDLFRLASNNVVKLAIEYQRKINEQKSN